MDHSNADILQVNERLVVNDAIGRYKPVRGRVQIFEESKDKPQLTLVRDQSNLVVYHGRSWLAQRALGIDLGEIPGTDATANPDRVGFKSKFISWVAFGSGGSYTSNPLDVTGPSLDNYGLAVHQPVGSGSRYVVVDSKQYHKFDDGYPLLLSDYEIPSGHTTQTYEMMEELYQTDYTDIETPTSRKADSFVIAKTVTTIDYAEYNGDGYLDLNEAGMFVGDSRDIAGPHTSMEMFARCTFSTYRKDASKKLLLIWYIFF